MSSVELGSLHASPSLIAAAIGRLTLRPPAAPVDRGGEH